MTTPKKVLFVLCLSAQLTLFVGCKQKQGDDEAIRAAVRQHLTALSTLNLQAMDMDFTRIAFQNNQASADVSFRPKTGAPAGASMQVSYKLEKQDGVWKVIKRSAPGGMIEHPNPNVNPHGQGVVGSVHGNLPNFQEILGAGASSTGGDLPATHPVASPKQSNRKP